MTQIFPVIRSMTFEEKSEASSSNQVLMMDHDCISYRLTSSTTDNLHVFKSGVTLVVLTVNSNLDYVCMDAYIGSEPDPIDSIFVQGEAAIQEFVGVSWRNLSLEALISRLTYFLN